MQIEQLFERINQLPHIPDVVRELIQQLDAADTQLRALGKKLTEDQALSLKVLRMANSAQFGLARQCASIEEAVVLLGTQRLRTLVIASGLIGAIKKIDGFDLRAFWRHTFSTASRAQWLARLGGQDADLAFTTGMLHNLGQPLLAMAAPERHRQVEDYVSHGKDRSRVEASLLGFDTAQVAAELARRWRFPDPLVEAIARHRDPLAFTTFTPAAGAVHAALLAGRVLDLEGEPGEVRDALPAALLQALNIAPTDLIDELDLRTAFGDLPDDLLDW